VWLAARRLGLGFAGGTAAFGQKTRGLGQSLPTRSGSCRPHAVVLAMRYVIVIVAIAFFLIWDGLYNHGYYLDQTVREMSRIVRTVTG